MGQGVLAEATEKTLLDLVDTKRVLVSHSSRGGKSVVEKGHVKGEEALGSTGVSGNVSGKDIKKFTGGKRGRGERRDLFSDKKGGDLLAHVFDSLVKETIGDKNLVGLGNSRGGGGD